MAIENFYLVKITDAIRSEIEGHASEIRNLSLSGCKLSSLHNFPNLPHLRRLDLNDNNLKDEDLLTLQQCSNLKYLALAGNKIKSIDAIKQLVGHAQLKMLDMFGCPLSKTDDYRAQMFKLFPKLQFLDLKNVEGEEVSYVASDDTMSEDEDEENDDFIDDDADKIANGDNKEESEGISGEEEIGEEDEEDEDGESGDEQSEEADGEGEGESTSQNNEGQHSAKNEEHIGLKRKPEIGLEESLKGDSSANGNSDGKPLKKIHTND